MFSAKRHGGFTPKAATQARQVAVSGFAEGAVGSLPRTAKPMGYAMNVRRGLFRLRSLFGLGDPLLWKADNLVQIAGMNAVTMFESLLKKFSFLREVDVKQWDFTLTVAGVFIAVTRLVDLGLRGNRQRKLMRKVGAKLTQWDPTNGRRAFEDCASFYERTFDELTSLGDEPRFVGSDALGSWVVWNVLGRPPQSEKEHQLVRVVGGMVMHKFFNWWQEKS